ncbi:MAG: HAD family hydrolase [Actinomycetota bacterium]|nr:HAD family hydrolase [Actinomycetota bacterium]
MSSKSPDRTRGWSGAADAVWAFDVDGTLIGSIRSDVLRPGACELLATLVRSGASCVLWSAGGADYARRMAARHGIEHHFVAFYEKDRRDADGKYRVDHFAAHHQPHVFVDDSPIDLRDDVHTIAVPQFIGGNLADAGLSSLLRSLQHAMITTTPTGEAHDG